MNQFVERFRQMSDGPKSAIYSLVLSFLVLAGFYALSGYFSSSDSLASKPETPATSGEQPVEVAPRLGSSSSDSPLSARDDSKEPSSPRSAEKLARARREAELVETLNLVDNIEQRLKRASDLAEQWNREFEPILQNDRGKRVASDDQAVQRFAALLQKEAPTADDLSALERALNVAAQPLRDLDAPGQVELSDEDQAYFQELLARVDASLEKLARRQDAAELIVASASSLEPANLTLEERINELEQDSIQQFVDEAAKARLAALEQKVQEESAAIQQAEERRIEAEAQKQIAKEEALAAQELSEKQEIQEQTRQALAKAERKKLEAEFARDRAEIQSVLAPFVTDGDSQPTVGNAYEPRSWIYNGGFGPVSFGRLQSAGTLDDSQEGLRRLYYFGGGPNNLRHKRGFPTYSRTGLDDAGIVSRVERARELLLKYGELMVEKGMLVR